MEWTGPDWMEKIRKHRNFYDQKERDGFDFALGQYQGDYWRDVDRRQNRSNLVSYNLIFAICESAMSNLLPPNMRFSVTEVDSIPQLLETEPEKDLELMARRGRWREEGALALVAAILYGRFVFKVTSPQGHPTVRSVDPRKIYFDFTTPRPWDIKYFIELCLRTPVDLQRAHAQGDLELPVEFLGGPGRKKLEALAQVYPAWVSDAANKTAGDYIQTWEVWDNECGCMSVWVEGIQEPVVVLEGEDYYCPYVLGNLNQNGQDCRGLSEVQLLKDVIAAINRMLTYQNEIVRRQIPVTLYNKSTMSEEEIANVASAAPGDFIGVTMGISGGAVMVEGPTSNVPPDLQAFQAKLEQIVSYVSALSDSSRGQITGARTATELALIESQQRNRLRTRTTAYCEAWSKAAALALMLKKGIPWSEFEGLQESIKIVANNAAELNRAVLQEKFQQVYQFCLSRPDSFDVAVLDKLFVEVFQLPPDFLKQAGEMTAPAPGGQSPPVPQVSPVPPVQPMPPQEQ